MKAEFSLADIRENAAKLSPYLRKTPVAPWESRTITDALGESAQVNMKLELFQVTGSFKARGALTGVLSLSSQEREKGLTAASAGNHAIAVAFAARTQGIGAKIAVFKGGSSMRVAMARDLGAEIIMTETGHEAFALAEKMRETEGRTFLHPFDGLYPALGNATLGLEIAESLPNLDAVIIAVGGGGLAGGVASAIKMLNPTCAIYGVEPKGANAIRQSLDKGSPISLEKVSTIADSLAAPMARPYSFALCQALVDDVVLVDDDSIAAALALMQMETKLAVEPSAATPAAAMLGPLREKLRGKNICLIVCGANIDSKAYAQALSHGERHLDQWLKAPISA